MPRAQDICVICNLDAESSDDASFVDACICTKKHDWLRCHRRCLLKAVSDADVDCIPRCQFCNQPFKVNLIMRWAPSLDKLLSSQSIGSIFEFLIVVFVFFIMLSMPFFMRYSIPPGPARDRFDHEEFHIMLGMCFLMTIAVAFTIRKVSRRWTKSMSDLSVVWNFPLAHRRPQQTIFWRTTHIQDFS